MQLLELHNYHQLLDHIYHSSLYPERCLHIQIQQQYTAFLKHLLH